MSTLTSRRTWLAQLLRDPEVRTGLYIWLIIAGLCVFLANAFAAGTV